MAKCSLVPAIKQRLHALLLIVLLSFPASPLRAQIQAEDDIRIRVEKFGQVNVVDVNVVVPATAKQTWAVLTDWENLPRFVTGIKASSIVARLGDTLRVRQTVRTEVWPFTFDIELDRVIEVFPHKGMQFWLLGGDFEKMAGSVRLIEEPAGTRILSHVESIPRFWIPPLIGPLIIESETRDQFRQIVGEILRRTVGAAAVPVIMDSDYWTR